MLAMTHDDLTKPKLKWHRVFFAWRWFAYVGQLPKAGLAINKD